MPNGGSAVVRRSFVNRKVSDSIISRTGVPRIIKFYTNIHTHERYSQTGYGIISCLPSEVIAKNLSKMPPQIASGQISVARRFSRLNQFVGFLYILNHFLCCRYNTGGRRFKATRLKLRNPSRIDRWSEISGRISQERFDDLEQARFTRTPGPIFATTIQDMTSLSASSQKV